MITQAGQLLRDALAHVLDKTPAPSRHHALLRQLLKQQQGKAGERCIAIPPSLPMCSIGWMPMRIWNGVLPAMKRWITMP